MAALADLLSRGYFPRELPPPFTTRHFAQAVVANRAAMPGSFTAGTQASRLSPHNLARHGTLRRPLSIPNPIAHFNLCDLVSTQWQALQSFTAKAAWQPYGAGGLSASVPRVTTTGLRAVERRYAFSLLPQLRALTRAPGRYLLRTDVSRFYPSIYTHSIPWALMTKAVAKMQTTGGLANDLDKCLRNAQQKQTMGIPIGPDTSLVVAEVILAAVDAAFHQRLGQPVSGFRYMDDYELVFARYSEAEAALTALQSALGDFELALNPLKSAIAELPSDMTAPWAEPLSQFVFGVTPLQQRARILRYFGLAFSLAAQFRDQQILLYAVGRVANLKVATANWPIVQALLLHSVMVEPGVIREVVDTIVAASAAGCIAGTAGRTQIEDVLNLQIEQHAPLGHGSEVAWALWAALALSLNISSAAAAALAEMDDSVVALLALDADKRGLFPGGLNAGRWAARMTAADLREEHWLLAYEANVQGWLPTLSGGDHVAQDPDFGWLKTRGVHFYDILKTPVTRRKVALGSAAALSLYP